MAQIVAAATEAHVPTVRRLFQEYADGLGVDLCFQDFESELNGLPGDYAPPEGALFLALDGAEPLGCVALRPLEPPRIAELKRLYVRPAGRGQGLGLALTRAALDAAASVGYERVRLDTLSTMTSAQRLYESLGFREIEPYRFNPLGGTRYLELVLCER